MSDLSPSPTEQRRTVVATYDSYPEAERAVDFLSDRGFEVSRVAIVGSGLKLVEQVAGRVTTARAALAGALQGALIGLLFALFLGIFFDIDEEFLGLLLYGVGVGALFGALFGALAQAAQRGRRDFASVTAMQADRYELQVDDELAARARELLTELDRPAAAGG